MAHSISPARQLLVRIKTSQFARELRVWPGYLPFRAALLGGAPLELDVNERIGMGAILAHALLWQSWADECGLPVRIISTSPLYSAEENVFERYFEPVGAPGPFQPLDDRATAWFNRKEAPDHIPLEQATAIFTRLFRPNEHLQALLKEAGGNAPFDLSIHMRGTDKVLDSGKVPRQVLLDHAAPFLDGAKRVFLATDDAEFARSIRKEWGGVTFVSYDLGEVQEGRPRHFSDLDPDLKARESLVNMFLLARAPVLLRTSSFMSSFSKLINPALRTITINRTTKFKASPFPEAEILQSEAEAGQ